MRFRRALSTFASRSIVGVMFAGAALLAACGEGTPPPVNEPQPAAVAGYYALEFARVAPPRFSSLSTDAGENIEVRVLDGPVVTEGVRLEPGATTGLLRVGGQLYVHAEFVLHNDTSDDLDGLVLLGYHREEFRASSAISQPMLALGRPAADPVVRRIRPTHRLEFDLSRAGSPDAFVGRPQMSHFVAFAEEDVPSVPEPFVTTVFPYGFSVGNGAAIPPGGQASVHVAFTFPAAARTGDASTSPNLASFTWNAVLVRADHTRVTQAPEENHERGWTAVLDRATQAGADSIVAIGPGVRQVTDANRCDALVGLTNVRIAGQSPTDGNYVGLLATAGSPQFDGCEGASP